MDTLQQSPIYRQALSTLGVETADAFGGFMVRRAVPMLGIQGLLSRATLPTGADLRALRQNGLRLVNAETPGDASALRAAGFRQIITPAHIAEVDLTPPAHTRRARMRQKWRNRLNRAQNSGLKLRSLGWSGCDHWLITQEAAQRAKRQYRTLPGPVLTALARTSPKAALIYEAWDGADPVAGMLFLRHGTTATYQLGWTSDAGRHKHAHTLLLAAAMDRLARDGHKILDLGLIETQTTPGLARFKLGCGADVRQLGGTWLGIPGL